ncbi:hypothetical protein MTR_2g012290 [Medicago truncatula]|uniref:Uncharacterized protein n=1 Tax=Medicago truncatula TaxID=3880 RepID=G7ILD7_MEDTR|nr:hypothetical protein MTR_2g012290 [Medicago truncatula]
MEVKICKDKHQREMVDNFAQVLYAILKRKPKWWNGLQGWPRWVLGFIIPNL